MTRMVAVIPLVVSKRQRYNQKLFSNQNYLIFCCWRLYHVVVLCLHCADQVTVGLCKRHEDAQRIYCAFCSFCFRHWFYLTIRFAIRSGKPQITGCLSYKLACKLQNLFENRLPGTFYFRIFINIKICFCAKYEHTKKGSDGRQFQAYLLNLFIFKVLWPIWAYLRKTHICWWSW